MKLRNNENKYGNYQQEIVLKWQSRAELTIISLIYYELLFNVDKDALFEKATGHWLRTTRLSAVFGSSR